MQWVPGHSNVSRNEIVGRYGKEAAQKGKPAANPLSYNTIKAIVRREVKEPRPEHLSTIEKKYMKWRK